MPDRSSIAALERRISSLEALVSGLRSADPEILRLREAARLIGVGGKRLRALALAGEIPSWPDPTDRRGTRLFSRADLMAWRDRQNPGRVQREKVQDLIERAGFG